MGILDQYIQQYGQQLRALQGLPPETAPQAGQGLAGPQQSPLPPPRGVQQSPVPRQQGDFDMGPLSQQGGTSVRDFFDKEDPDRKQLLKIADQIEKESPVPLDEQVRRVTGSEDAVKNLDRGEKALMLVEFGLGLLSASGPGGHGEDFFGAVGEAGQRTMQSAQQRSAQRGAAQRQREGMQLERDRMAQRDREMGMRGRQHQEEMGVRREGMDLEREGQRISREQHKEEQSLRKRLHYTPRAESVQIIGDDGELLLLNTATNRAAPVLDADGKPMTAPESLRTGDPKFESEYKLNTMISTLMDGRKREDISDEEMSKINRVAAEVAFGRRKDPDEDIRRASDMAGEFLAEAPIGTAEEVAKIIPGYKPPENYVPGNAIYFDDLTLDQKTIVHSYMQDKLVKAFERSRENRGSQESKAKKVDPKKLVVGMVTPVTDQETGQTDYWTGTEDGEGRQLTEEEVSRIQGQARGTIQR